MSKEQAEARTEEPQPTEATDEGKPSWEITDEERERERLRKMADYLTLLRGGDEEAMRDAIPVWPHTQEELAEIIGTLEIREHDYGTCVYAMSHAAIAAYHYMAGRLGVTGFQASCADLDFLRMSRMMEDGFRIVDFNKLLYPQHFDRSIFPAPFDLLQDQKDNLARRAKEHLRGKGDFMHPNVREHMEWLADGQPDGEYSQNLARRWATSRFDNEDQEE